MLPWPMAGLRNAYLNIEPITKNLFPLPYAENPTSKLTPVINSATKFEEFLENKQFDYIHPKEPI